MAVAERHGSEFHTVRAIGAVMHVASAAVLGLAMDVTHQIVKRRSPGRARRPKGFDCRLALSHLFSRAAPEKLQASIPNANARS